MTGCALYVAGTDTGVGKTAVACALARAMRDRGLRVGVFKPVETGCADPGRPADALALIELGADCGSDHEVLIDKFRLKLKKVGKTTRPFRYDLNQIP